MTETVMTERALIVMAVCLVIQTIGMTIGSIAVFVTWRRTKLELDSQIAELRGKVDRVSDSVEQAAHAFEQSVSAVHDAVDGTREAVKTAAAIVSSPKTALAFGALRGLQWWKRVRAEQRARTALVRQPRLIVRNRS
jgi:hypothetical protein